MYYLKWKHCGLICILCILYTNLLCQDTIKIPFLKSNIVSNPVPKKNGNGVYPAYSVNKNFAYTMESFDNTSAIGDLPDNAIPGLPGAKNVVYAGQGNLTEYTIMPGASLFLNRKFSDKDFPMFVSVDCLNGGEFNDYGYLWIGPTKRTSYNSPLSNHPEREFQEGLLIGGSNNISFIFDGRTEKDTTILNMLYSHGLGKKGQWNKIEILLDKLDDDLWIRSFTFGGECTLPPPFSNFKRIKNFDFLRDFNIGVIAKGLARDLKIVTNFKIFSADTLYACQNDLTTLNINKTKEKFCYQLIGRERWLIDGINYNGDDSYLRDVIFTKSGTFDVEYYFNDVLEVKTKLIVYPAYTKNIKAYLCPNKQLVLNNVTYVEEGKYIQNLKTINGCDSILNIEVLQGLDTEEAKDYVLCKGEKVYVGNNTITEAGEYHLVIPNRYDCDSTLTLNVTISSSDLSSLDFGADTICQFESVKWTLPPVLDIANSKFIFNKERFIPPSTTSYEPPNSGKLTLNGITFDGCNFSRDKQYDVLQYVEAAFEGSINCEGKLTLEGSNLNRYPIQIFRENALVNTLNTNNAILSEDGDYTLSRITNEGFSCRSAHSITLTKKSPLSSKDLANIINPGISENGQWCVKQVLTNIDAIDQYQCTIYDRWGTQVFNTKDIDQCWDGSINSKRVASGVYLFQIKLVDKQCDNLLRVVNGSITVID